MFIGVPSRRSMNGKYFDQLKLPDAVKDAILELALKRYGEGGG